jgi:hypothetical protein
MIRIGFRVGHVWLSAPIMGRRMSRPNDDGLGQFLALIAFGMFAAFMLRVAFG